MHWSGVFRLFSGLSIHATMVSRLNEDIFSSSRGKVKVEYNARDFYLSLFWLCCAVLIQQVWFGLVIVFSTLLIAFMTWI